MPQLPVLREKFIQLDLTLSHVLCHLDRSGVRLATPSGNQA